MKRHKSLHPLSREHHTGLVFAKRLKESDEANASKVKEEFYDYWEKDLKIHFRKEEEILFPFLFGHFSFEESEIRDFFLQHAEIRKMIFENGSSLESLHKLGELIHDHIRFEENKLFPLIESRLNEKDFAGIMKVLD
ncbi:MAG: hemerythrin domain-containing protein [Calditrichaeota bacterium]|nr:MAG: hemerythrin domain-containing protein [Calditrichota bacterium]